MADIDDVLKAIEQLSNELSQVAQIVHDIKPLCDDIAPIKTKCDGIIATLAKIEIVKIPCYPCQGTGIVTESYHLDENGNPQPGGSLTRQVTCYLCGGTGKAIFAESQEDE